MLTRDEVDRRAERLFFPWVKGEQGEDCKMMVPQTVGLEAYLASGLNVFMPWSALRRLGVLQKDGRVEYLTYEGFVNARDTHGQPMVKGVA